MVCSRTFPYRVVDRRIQHDWERGLDVRGLRGLLFCVVVCVSGRSDADMGQCGVLDCELANVVRGG